MELRLKSRRFETVEEIQQILEGTRHVTRKILSGSFPKVGEAIEQGQILGEVQLVLFCTEARPGTFSAHLVYLGLVSMK